MGDDLPDQPPDAWVSLLRAHASLTRKMDGSLRASHDLTVNEYEVLLQLYLAEDERLRRVDLADHLLITQGGITRILATLEEEGLVDRCGSPEDGRVVFARLTDTGRAKLLEARMVHLGDVSSMFTDKFNEQELEDLATYLTRLYEV